ncbi:SprT-like family-domain-containing protein [Chaetomium fimeti]|uniref:SprT-like family-domain-containing protein n=1 Tax=Chaetomium fimeti TaxID=1854472 RepID=A0AAE0LN47_9PEZI|nr:SprT-like family-domain-containing protein [Chaetomium fimeti]
MARLAKSTIWSDDDEFPDIDALVTGKKPRSQKDALKSRQKPNGPFSTQEAAKPAVTVRRRKLAPLTDNLLLRAWTPDSAEDDGERRGSDRETENMEPRRTRVELRTRRAKSAAAPAPSPLQDEEFVSAQEEVTITDDVSLFDGTFHTCNSEGSDYSGSEDFEEDGKSQPKPLRTGRLPVKPLLRMVDKTRSGRASEDATDNYCSTPEAEKDNSNRPGSDGESSIRLHDAASKPARAQKGERRTKKATKGLADSMSKLQLSNDIEEEFTKSSTSCPSDREATPPPAPPSSRPGLTSPTKLLRIPTTPHRPNSDMFWSQEFVDDWNEEHSPAKQLFPDPVAARQNSPTKANPKTTTKRSTSVKEPSEREVKLAFEKTKHELARTFLQELDQTITNGKLAELTASTGGIKVVWTHKFNRTAGQAIWKRETITPQRQPDGTTTTPAAHKHHASIELAEKVIDSEPRLINVVAHEFCHLATFMVSGVKTNPHGAEFKAWGARVSRAFAGRGIAVTTKHSYDINTKYVWTCVACAAEFKRHSRSIDPARHACGACKGKLVQTKPVPRRAKGSAGGGGDGDGAAAAGGEGKKEKVVSAYQAFMKEQMRAVKAQNPGCAQKEIMRIVASRWAAKKAATAALMTPPPDEGGERL